MPLKDRVHNFFSFINPLLLPRTCHANHPLTPFKSLFPHPCELVKPAKFIRKKIAGDVDYVEYDNKSHFLCGEPGWEFATRQVYGWIQGKEKAVAASTL